jgi:hypothetical protein
MSTLHPGEVTGYAVALPDRYDTAGQPVFFGGGKLAPDLTLPRLQRRRQPDPTAGASPGQDGEHARQDRSRRAAPSVGADRFGLTPAERQRIWESASAAAACATAQITASAATDPGRAADAAWAASDFLAAAGRVVEGRRGGPLTAAAEQYDRAAREVFGTVPVPTPAGHGLRSDHPTLGRWLRQLSSGRLVLDKTKIAAEERLDGKYLLSTSDPDLSAEDVALGYKNLLEAERGFRDLKSTLELRPVFHRVEPRIRAHVLLCWLALLLIRVVERRTGLTWRRIEIELSRLHAVTLTGSAGTVVQTTPLTDAQATILRACEIPPPPRVTTLHPA